MNIYAMLFLFFGLYLSISIWVFLIITDAVKKISVQGFFHVQKDFAQTVDRHFILLSKNQMVAEEEIHTICKELYKNKNKRYFLQKFIYSIEEIKDKNYVREYFKTAFPYLREMLQFGRRMHYSEKSYRLMLLGEFRQDLKEINAFILDALDDESFDVRTNSLRALSVIGNSDYFNKGLMKVCNSEKYFNTRHISEMMVSFEGDHEELENCMLYSFYENLLPYQYQVIVYLAARGSSTSMDFVINYLIHNLNSKEIVIACLRYFTICEIKQKAKDIILKLFDNEDHEIRAVVVKLAPIYFKNNPEVVRILFGEKYLKSKDWYVRKNSATALVKIGLTKEELIGNSPIEDNYAMDALIYAMFEEGLITYEEFMKLGGSVVDEYFDQNCG